MNTRKIIQSLSAVAIAVGCASGAFANEEYYYLDRPINLPASQDPVGVRVPLGASTSEDYYYLDQANSLPPSQVKVGAYRADNAPFGSTAQGVQAARIIKINDAAKAVNVNRDEVVTIVNGEKAFTWKFQTLGAPTFDLAKIAPQNFGAGNVRVYVAEMAETD